MISSNQNMLFPISEFFYKLIRFLLHSSVVKSENEIGKFSYYNMECPGGLGECLDRGYRST